MTRGTSSPPSETPPRRLPWTGLAWAAVALAAVVAGAAVWLATCRTVDESRRAATAAVDRVARSAGDIAERFRTGRITTTFIAAIPRLLPDSGVQLELAAFEATETFSRSDDRSVFFGLVPLGTTVSEIRVPVTYRYHVRLDEPWHLSVREHTCLVSAPALRPALPPAIHTDRMEKRVSSGWLRFDDREQMETLERTITPRLNARAANADHVGLVRETCRVRLAEFVRSWLLAEDHWSEARFRAVVVRFADEPPAREALLPPTLTLEGVEPGGGG